MKNDLGRRAICGRCDLEIERHPPQWLDHGNNSHCRDGRLHLAAGENVWTLLGDTAKRHMMAICGDAVTKSNIIGLKKAYNADWRRQRRYSTGVTAPKIGPDEMEQIESAIGEKQPRVVGDLHESGLKLLRSKRYARRLAHVADIIADIDCFRLIGFQDCGDRAGNFIPVYRALARDGRSFAFVNVPWQSGGDGPELQLNTNA